MGLTADLQNIVDSDRVHDDTDTRRRYASDQSFVKPYMPDAVVYAQTIEDVQAITRYANSSKTPLIPFSSGLNLHGGTIPREGGIILDVSRMNSIDMIDTENRFAVIQPGVTAQVLQDELKRHGLKAMLPFGIPPGRSALTSYIERDPALAAASFEYGNEHIMDMEIILPDGELFRTGLWSTGGKPGSPMGPVRAMMNRLWTGAQGTLGVVTKIALKVEYLPQKRKIVCIPFDSFPESIEPLRLMQRKEIGHECFVLNSFNTASLMCSHWSIPDSFPAEAVESDSFNTLRSQLPPWLLFVCLNGGPRLPDKKIAYEEDALRDICNLHNLTFYKNSDLDRIMKPCIDRPWDILKKFRFKGTVHDVSFKTTLQRFPDFQKILLEVISQYDYPLNDVGVYVLPVERGRAVHCEIDLHAPPEQTNKPSSVTHKIWHTLSERFIDEGAFFDRPYGIWADMVYSRAGTYTQKLKQIKSELDPHNILNPGQLCF